MYTEGPASVFPRLHNSLIMMPLPHAHTLFSAIITSQGHRTEALGLAVADGHTIFKLAQHWAFTGLWWKYISCVSGGLWCWWSPQSCLHVLAREFSHLPATLLWPKLQIYELIYAPRLKTFENKIYPQFNPYLNVLLYARNKLWAPWAV